MTINRVGAPWAPTVLKISRNYMKKFSNKTVFKLKAKIHVFSGTVIIMHSAYILYY